MMTPGLEVVGEQDTPDSGGGDVLNNPLRDELVRQFVAVPWGEAATSGIRPFIGEPYHVHGDLWGENPPWPRGQERLRDHPAGGREGA
jgi:hypothetical protein